MRWCKAKKERGLWRQAEMFYLKRGSERLATVQALAGGRWFWYGCNPAAGFVMGFNSLADGNPGEKSWATLEEAKAAARAAQGDPQEVSR